MKRDVYQEITDKVIAAIEAGIVPWASEWAASGQPMHLPMRQNGILYRGLNVLLLWISAYENGYGSSQWMTYRQAQDMGAQVRKGERGTRVIFYSTHEKEREDGETDTYRFLKTYTVFNVAQVDGLPADYDMTLNGIDTGAELTPSLSAFYEATGAALHHTGGQPCYDPARDVIQMPHIHQFETVDAYYGTLAHECIHWTGHASRLDRLKTFGTTSDYAFEELVAELGACFVTARLGGARNTDNSAAYIAGWLKALRNDKKFIFRAAAQAQTASDFLIKSAAEGGCMTITEQTQAA